MILLPRLPWRSTAAPHLIEQSFLAKRVHALPERRMAVGHKFAVSRELLEGFALPHRRVSVDVVEDAWLQHEERAVDPAFAERGLFAEAAHYSVCRHIDQAETRWRTHDGHRRESAVCAMEGEKLVEIDIRQAVAPCEHEGSVADMRLQPLDPASRHRVRAGIDEVDGPVEAVRRVMKRNRPVSRADRE